MEFCECGSLVIGGNCTNKKCPKHVKKYEQISADQITAIRALMEKLERDYNESDFKSMTSDEAQRMIDDLGDELEELRTRKESEVEDEETNDYDEVLSGIDIEEEDET